MALTRRGRRLRLPQTAASLAFLSLLALVPVFTIAVSLLGALPILGKLRQSLLQFLAANFFLPSFSETLVGYLNQFAAKVSELSLLGAVTFLATAFSALLTIDRTLNRIWSAPEQRPLVRRLTIYWTFLTLGPLLLAASLTVNGIIASEVFGGAPLRHVERAWLSAFPWITSVGGLTLLYRIVPNAPVRWSDAMAGALTAAIGLDILKRLMAFQVVKLPTYTVVYGAFAALPLFLMWLFLMWLMVLAGALLAASIPYWGVGSGGPRERSPARRFDLASAVLMALLRGARDGHATLQPRALTGVFDGDPSRAEATARLLVSLGYLDRYWRLDGPASGDGERTVWAEHWGLRSGAGSMSLRPIFELLWQDSSPSDGAVLTQMDFSVIDRPLMDLPA